MFWGKKKGQGSKEAKIYFFDNFHIIVSIYLYVDFLLYFSLRMGYMKRRK